MASEVFLLLFFGKFGNGFSSVLSGYRPSLGQIPWAKIFSSPPVWAAVLANTAYVQVKTSKLMVCHQNKKKPDVHNVKKFTWGLYDRGKHKTMFIPIENVISRT